MNELSLCSSDKDSATVGKGRDLTSFRRHFRMGFMTMPASQDLSPGPCVSAMAPRSQSCHAVGGGGANSLDNGDYPAPPLPAPSSSSSSSSCSARCPPTKPKRHPSTRLSSTPDSPQDGPKSAAKHTEKRSDLGEGSGKKVPPLKPRRSPNTQLSLDPPALRAPPSATPLPRPLQVEPEEQEGSGDEEPVYIEMVGQVFTRDTQNPTPHPPTPDSDSDQSEAIYEEMNPQPPRAPTPFLLPGNKPDPAPGSNKIPAPFPNLLQHRPPLLALPQPAASSSGVGPQNKPPPPKLGTVSIQAPIGLTSPGTPTPPASSKLPIPHPGSKDPSLGGGGAPPASDKQDVFLSPAPGLRARSHSTPLPPSSSSSSSSHYTHPHQQLHPSHYHQYRRHDRDLPTSHSMKLGPQASAQTPPLGGAKEGKGVTFLLKPDKREREGRAHTAALSQTSPTHMGTSSAPSQPPSSSSQRPTSRPLLQRSQTPHPASPSLPAYKPPPSDSPQLWTYPSVGLRGRPPAYDSLRGGVQADPPPKSSPVTVQRKGGSLTRDGGLGGSLGGRKLSFSHSRETERIEGRAWNGSTDALSWPEREEQGIAGHSGIPVRCGRGGGVGEGGAGGVASSVAGRVPGRSGLPLPCQAFPAFPQNGETGVKQGGYVHRQCSLPPGGVMSQPPGTPPMPHPQHQLHLQQHYHHLAQLVKAQAQFQPPACGGAVSSQGQRDGKLQEVIERKRSLCREIKAHRRPDRGLCKQDSMPVLPSWRRTPEPNMGGAPNSQAQQAILWDTAI
ncbi:hypothetical protein SKAU_G00321200 [Synaphobranchus kaupii]|uniref:Neuronal tyrosine-phosphorylated phosphoinositide-3-kinase adapter 1 n=1 Tax=Synaphobranchus kaupii TaxID=118154 RepID=A0A9Q1ENS1_SYNKA|nr:hypothetical protein SKAU_G00321200 [Synaphobranchus kaupii]